MDCNTLGTVSAKLQGVNRGSVYQLQEGFYPHTAYLGPECHFGSFSVRIGVTIQKKET